MSVNADFAATVPWDGILNPQLASTTEPGLVPALPGDKTLFFDGTGHFAAPASAEGDVTGPASATAGHLALFTDGTGKVIEDGGAPPSSLPPDGSAGGDLGGSYPDPLVEAIHSAGTQLAIGSIPDGSFLKRSGATVVGGTPSGSGNVTGPVSSVSGNIAVFSGTSGEIIADVGIAPAAFLQKANNLSDVANATTALDNLLPSQTGNSGKALVTNGTAASWQTVAGATPPEIFLTNYATLALADAAANAIGAVLVLNTITGTALAVTSSITVVSPVRFAGVGCNISSGQVLTLLGGIVGAPLTKIFNGSGTVQLNSKTPITYAEWFGSTSSSSGDDGAAINLALNAAYNGSPQDQSTFSWVNRSYYLQNTVLVQNQGQSVISMPGAILKPSGVSPASIGLIIGTAGAGSINIECPMFLPAFNGFSAIGLQLKGCCLANITTGLIQGCPDGVEFYSDNVYGDCLDNDVTVSGGIYTALDAAIKVKTAGNSSHPGTIQGNVIYANFINTCVRWVYFVNTASGGGQGAQDVNTFKTEAIDWNTVTGFIAVDNSAGYANTANIFRCDGFFASGAASPTAIGSYGNGQFEGCEFYGFPSPFTSYAQMGLTETSKTNASFGNRYDAGGGQSQNLTNSAASPTAAAIATYNGGFPTVAIFNRINLTMTIPGGGLAAGATQNFYIYSVIALGNARLGFNARGMQGCVVNQLTDNTNTNAYEILIQVLNVSGSTVTAGTVLTGQVTIGIP